jgi:hypothetical protein
MQAFARALGPAEIALAQSFCRRANHPIRPGERRRKGRKWAESENEPMNEHQ